MIAKYSATLALVVLLITYILASFEFASRSQVLSGAKVEENLHFEFTLDADGDHTYRIESSLKQDLEDDIQFHGEGVAHVVSSKIDITSKDVSWSEGHTNYTSTGAAMDAAVQWDTPADSASGSHGTVFMDFPVVPGFEKATPTFHSGGYQKEGANSYVVRQVTTYRSPFAASAARFLFALPAGLAFGILLHAIGWAIVLAEEKGSRIASWPPQGSGLPQTFYPNPVLEWARWLLVLGFGGFIASMVSGFAVNSGFMIFGVRMAVYVVLAVAAALAWTSVYVTRKNILTFRVAAEGISYARGRVDPQWMSAAWSEVLSVSQMSRTSRGNTSYWIEIEFYDDRKMLKIDQSMHGYAALRDTLLGAYEATRRG